MSQTQVRSTYKLFVNFEVIDASRFFKERKDDNDSHAKTRPFIDHRWIWKKRVFWLASPRQWSQWEKENLPGSARRFLLGCPIVCLVCCLLTPVVCPIVATFTDQYSTSGNSLYACPNAFAPPPGAKHACHQCLSWSCVTSASHRSPTCAHSCGLVGARIS